MKKEFKKTTLNKDKVKKNATPAGLSGRQKIIFPLLLFIITFIVYFPVFQNGFTNWDDAGYVTDNPLVQNLNTGSIGSFFSGYQMGNYHPLAMISLAVDYLAGGMNPIVFHLTNLLLHIINSLLVYGLVILLVKNRHIAFTVALLFGIQTLHVESVAWISERKDVLYSLFFLSSLMLYLRYIDSRKWLWYIISLLLFIMSLFSKGQAVTLSVTLLLADYIKGRKLNDIKLIAEKIPFFLLSVIFGIIAIKAQKHGNSLIDISVFSFPQRITFASYGYLMYLIKLIIPFGLSAIYPYPDISVKGMPSYFWAFPFLVIAIITLVISYFRKDRWVIFGFLFFSVNIFTVLQLLPVGSAIMADRYSYIPSAGIFMIIAVGFFRLVERTGSARTLLYTGFIIYFFIIGLITGFRVTVWQNSLTLWNDVIEKYPRVMTAWENRGSYRNEKGDFRGAVEDYTQAIILKPDYADAYYNRGIAYYSAGDAKAALADYNAVERLKPRFPDNYYNRGITRHALGDNKGALADYNKATELDPRHFKAYSNRGNVKRDLNDISGAIADYSKAIELYPYYDDALSNRGAANGTLGNYKEAIKDFDRAIQVNGKYQTAWYLRGMAKIKLGKIDDGCKDLTIARQLGNKNAEELIRIHCNR